MERRGEERNELQIRTINQRNETGLKLDNCFYSNLSSNPTLLLYKSGSEAGGLYIMEPISDQPNTLIVTIFEVFLVERLE